MRKEEFEKLQELLEKEEIQDNVCDCTNVEEFKKIFTDQGVEFEENEAEQIYEGILNKLEEGEELSEMELLDVSGGTIIGGVAIIAGGILASYIMARIGWRKIKKMSRYK